MRPGEPIRDPNVAAYYLFHGGMRLVEHRPNPIPLSPWGRLFTFWATFPPMVRPDECRRVGLVLHAGERFRERIDLYVNSLRLEARERFSAMHEGPAVRT